VSPAYSLISKVSLDARVIWGRKVFNLTMGLDFTMKSGIGFNGKVSDKRDIEVVV
jgi:hypothetical protein